MLPNDVAKLEIEIRTRSEMLASVKRTRELLLLRRREANDAATWMLLDKSLESNDETTAFLTAMLAIAQFKLDSLRAPASPFAPRPPYTPGSDGPNSP